MDASGSVLFREEQRLRQWWIWGIVLVVTALSWWTFLEQIVGGEPWGDRPLPDWAVWLIFLLFGIGLPVTLYFARLIVTVDEEVVRIRWTPFARRTVRVSEIESSEARTYRPLLEYGGWGVRWAPGRGTAWNASGNRGVQLELTSGKRLLIGSQRAEELAEAIERARGAGVD
jgi:hypothetical protein